MAFINEDRLEDRIMTWSKGRVVLACAAAAAIGFAAGAFFF